jgi:DNA mismatch repair protein MutH
MAWSFVTDERLGIPLPFFENDWEDYTEEERSLILLRWEEIRGTIPDYIKKLERIIIRKQDQLNVEDNFKLSCQLNSEIAELAGTINELNLWFRVNQELTASAVHH